MTNIIRILENIREIKNADQLYITNITPVLDTTTGKIIGYNYTAEFRKANEMIFLVNVFDKDIKKTIIKGAQ